ncbi:Amino-acid transporter arg-13 [Psilocybe cubensis]|uniref:Amino-acid transporter arg-13 n=2 Tax=Psilocybe cubensis TaxID=181762 RepID=A0ACB8GQB9_PSICU|nr:Amino-acid transporter arg-13 [Psilocybe cubensis]KAH9477818.1 Amino-acid transporter arg-13 [Psilocybe cubensis]
MGSTVATGGEVASTIRTVDHVGPALPDDDGIMTAKKAAKDIMFGSIAGMVAEVFEYPFDLAKVRLQAQVLTPSSSNVARFEGPMHCLMQTWKEEGVRGLYRGLPAPIVGSMAETASLFLAYTAFQNAIRSYYSTTSPSTPLSIPQLSLAAGGAGFLTSFVLTPIELIKCKMQVQMLNFHPPPAAPGRIPRRPDPTFATALSLSNASHNSHSASTSATCPQATTTGRKPMHDLACKSTSLTTQTLRPPGPIALIRSIVDKYGVRGLWLGHTGTLFRETGGTASWFVAKEYFARKLVDYRIRQSPYVTVAVATTTPGGNAGTVRVPRTHANTELLAWESALSGALAGAVGALLFYPADTVKSYIQTEEEMRPKGATPSTPRTQSTFLGTFRKMWVRHGLKGLYAGCGMTVARAVPSSGIIFVVYDGLTAYFA